VVKNHSRKHTAYIISEPRSLRYDAAARTLHVGLCEPPATPRGPTVIHMPQLLPHQMAVMPDAEVELQLAIPKVLHRLQIDVPGVPIEDIDVSTMERIECTLAVGSAPFYGRSVESAEEMRTRLNAWGSTITHVMEVERIQSTE